MLKDTWCLSHGAHAKHVFSHIACDDNDFTWVTHDCLFSKKTSHLVGIHATTPLPLGLSKNRTKLGGLPLLYPQHLQAQEQGVHM